MTDLTRIPALDGLAPAPQYSHVVMGTGRLVAISGQFALDADGKLVGDGDPAASAVQVAASARPEFLMEIEAPPRPKGVGAPPAVITP